MTQRTILFRGKRIDNGEWLYGNIQVPKPPFDKYFMWSDNQTQHDVDPATVGQFTGLTDKNGVKIFEGDIVGNDNNTEKNEVRYGLFNPDVNPDYSLCTVIGFYSTPEEGIGFDINGEMPYEVIGNIHDNPELI